MVRKSDSNIPEDESLRDAVDVVTTTSETHSGPQAMLTCCAALTYVLLTGCVELEA
jgi:hypothetical protein